MSKILQILSLQPRISKNFEITRTIYSNSERSVQFLKQTDFLTCPWRFLKYNTLEQLEFKLEKTIGIYALSFYESKMILDRPNHFG